MSETAITYKLIGVIRGDHVVVAPTLIHPACGRAASAGKRPGEEASVGLSGNAGGGGPTGRPVGDRS